MTPESDPPVYRIKNWNGLQFERHDNSRVNGPMRWVAIPTKHDGKGFRKLMREPDGPALYGCWVLLVAVAAKCDVRGTLADEDGPLSVEDISLKTDAAEDHISRAITFLMSIGWVEQVPLSAALRQGCAEVRTTEQNRTEPDKTEQDTTSVPVSVSDSAETGTVSESGSDSDGLEATEPTNRGAGGQKSTSSVWSGFSEMTLKDRDKLFEWFNWQTLMPKPVLKRDDFDTCKRLARSAVEKGKNPVAYFKHHAGNPKRLAAFKGRTK